MKKEYVKPLVEIERYKLDASFAANCGTDVTIGPRVDGVYEACSEFVDPWEVSSYGLQRSNGTSFYEPGLGQCDCYYSSGGEGYFTS